MLTGCSSAIGSRSIRTRLWCSGCAAGGGGGDGAGGRSRDRVHRLAIRLTGNSSDAEEVMQDALWSATRKIDRFRGTAAFRSWLYRITLNAAGQKLRGDGGRERGDAGGLLPLAERLPC